jgi:predicted nuclease of restriction endonuclease-like (RecB) superfamily
MKAIEKNLIGEIKLILEKARESVVRSVNKTIASTYFEIGRLLVNEHQKGEKRAVYGEKLTKEISRELTREFGKGFSVDNLENMRKFYLTYGKSETTSRKSKILKPDFSLSWSHYQKLMRIEDQSERKFYEIESLNNNWSVRELQRQFDSALYERLVLSRNKGKVKELGKKGLVITQPKDAIKEPYILEFLGLREEESYSESEFESAIIDKLEHFLLELGKGFTFVARQQRISFDERHFHIDLVFYNRILKCFVLIDLKIGDIKHQDLGQMQMYVNYYDRNVKLTEENNTVGIILCKDKSETLVEITLPEDNKQIFASKYKTVLPSKTELKKLIESKKD